MPGDGKAVRFIAYLLNQVQGGIVPWQLALLPGGAVDQCFEAGLAGDALGNPDDLNPTQLKLAQDIHGLGHLTLPTIDEQVVVGSHSSISDAKNNVHWLQATSETAFTFDVIVASLHEQDYEIYNIDPRAAYKNGQGRLVAPRLSVEEALAKYG